METHFVSKHMKGVGQAHLEGKEMSASVRCVACRGQVTQNNLDQHRHLAWEEFLMVEEEGEVEEVEEGEEVEVAEVVGSTEMNVDNNPGMRNTNEMVEVENAEVETTTPVEEKGGEFDEEEGSQNKEGGEMNGGRREEEKDAFGEEQIEAFQCSGTVTVENMSENDVENMTNNEAVDRDEDNLGNDDKAGDVEENRGVEKSREKEEKHFDIADNMVAIVVTDPKEKEHVDFVDKNDLDKPEKDFQLEEKERKFENKLRREKNREVVRRHKLRERGEKKEKMQSEEKENSNVEMVRIENVKNEPNPFSEVSIEVVMPFGIAVKTEKFDIETEAFEIEESVIEDLDDGTEKNLIGAISMSQIHSEGEAAENKIENADKSCEREDIELQKHFEHFLALCKNLLPLKEFEPVSSKILSLKNGLSEEQEESSSLKSFLVEQVDELNRDKSHVYIHIKAVIDRINKDIEDCKTIERIKKAIEGDKTDSTGQNEKESEKVLDAEEVDDLSTKEERTEVATEPNEAKKRKKNLTKSKPSKKAKLQEVVKQIDVIEPLILQECFKEKAATVDEEDAVKKLVMRGIKISTAPLKPKDELKEDGIGSKSEIAQTETVDTLRTLKFRVANPKVEATKLILDNQDRQAEDRDNLPDEVNTDNGVATKKQANEKLDGSENCDDDARKEARETNEDVKQIDAPKSDISQNQESESVQEVKVGTLFSQLDQKTHEPSDSNENGPANIELANDKEIVITNVEKEEHIIHKKSYTIQIDFKFAPSNSFELIKFDPKCLLYQEKVLPRKVPMETRSKTDVSLEAILAKARQGGSFADLLPDMIWEETKVKRERLEEEEERESKKRIKLIDGEDTGVDIKPITLDDVMFEEELYDRFSDEDDEEEEKGEEDISEKVLEKETVVENTEAKKVVAPPPQASFILFSTLNTEPDFLSENEDEDIELVTIKEASNAVLENPVKTVVKLRMTSVKEGMMEKVVEEENMVEEVEEKRRSRSTSPWMASSKLYPLLSL